MRTSVTERPFPMRIEILDNRILKTQFPEEGMLVSVSVLDTAGRSPSDPFDYRLTIERVVGGTLVHPVSLMLSDLGLPIVTMTQVTKLEQGMRYVLQIRFTHQMIRMLDAYQNVKGSVADWTMPMGKVEEAMKALPGGKTAWDYHFIEMHTLSRMAANELSYLRQEALKDG